VEDTPITSGMVEFRDKRGKLIGACLTDWLSDGLSAVYSFYEPSESRRSLGTYAILWLVARAQAVSLPYVYLGYWVPESRKMTYKARFKPSETLAGGIWRVLPEHQDAPAVAEPPVKVSVSG
jgi:arginine-tRNA-protein transferase